MGLSVITFNRERHLEAAASLLAERHRRDREREPLFPAAFEDAAACRTQIEHAFETAGWHGVVAEEAGGVVGFMVMMPQNIAPTHMLASFFPPRGASIPYAAHATKSGLEYDGYRAMYAALAEQFVAEGYFDHALAIPAADVESREAWASLGFGRTLVCAVRDVAPTAKAPASVELHQASAEDAEIIYALSEELTLHHARAPIFNPYIRESDTAAHDFQKNLLNEPAANAHWIAYDDGRAVGMNTFMQPFFLAPPTVPEKTIYLFQGIVTQDARFGGVGTAILSKGVEWAREQGYERIALHFASANLQGAKFWQSSGFRPIEHSMRRRVDERIAWANR